MRLSNIKLSGFKSFVDPTNLIISDTLVGIVGPNGCGKSNIIDAITWVMGESSAKHLRGESLTDVIFSGSNARQPVGQASVELVFDNTGKKIGGQYASYNEISVKRQIVRDAVSAYYLNGTRCRRRDITAIFLGTGLGPRSYAIIEQGMISQLIEAKPEELRIFIEEAAGISKYHERRRQTENRVKHTKENLERLNDIRDELEKQLNHLQRQAKAAERYKLLKEEERQLNLELLALNWRDLSGEMSGLQEEMGKRENAVESVVAKVRKTEAAIEKLRDELSDANQHFNNMQSEYYKVGSDISQHQQKLQHAHEKFSTLSTELETVNQSYTSTVTQHEQDKAEYEKLQLKLSDLEPKLQDSRSEGNKAYELLNHAEEAMQCWQIEWDRFNESFSELTRQEQIDKTRLEHLEFGVDELAEQCIKLEQAISKFEESDFSSQIQELKRLLEEEASKQMALTNSYAEKQDIVKKYRGERKTLSSQLDVARQGFQSLKGRLTSLKTLQYSTLEDNRELRDWLKENYLDQKPRLSQSIKINTRWMQALETVTGTHLHDICVEDINHYLDKLENVPGRLSLINTREQTQSTNIKNYPRLVDEITTELRIPAVLGDIYLATSLSDAIKMLADLSAGQSVVTEKGIWLSHDWVIVNHVDVANDSILNREAEISALKSQLEKQNTNIQSIATALHTTEGDLEQAEALLNEQQLALTTQQQVISDIRARFASTKTESEQYMIRYRQFVEELDLNQDKIASDKAENDSIKQRLAQVAKDKIRFQQQRDALSDTKENHRNALNMARQSWQETHNKSHGIALQLESYRSQYGSYKQAIKRNNIQLDSLKARKSDFKNSLSESKKPLNELQEKIEAGLKNKLHSERNLTDARIVVQAIEAKVREFEKNRHEYEQTLEALREALEKARLDVNSCQVRIETVAEKLSATEQNAEKLLADLKADANQEECSVQLESVAGKIQHLGPINLAAIDEYSQSSERKTYLDSQHQDLAEALTTLDNAIRKIDKETRTRFKETFDELNKNIKEMFPVLFGGGHAYLELMDADLLRTGVAIMACPPGKKNSNIHLLSGGEKALTAVALIFSIFKLNPAPFCILDEVDAPLDDANVIRFSELVQSMSNEVQFIFITHNKITMEIANRLLGITMNEPGVSRLVSVDMDQAVEMAATA